MSSKETGGLAGYRVAIGAVTLIGACILMILALFRETPLFWTNVGGYPLWLRDLVKLGFYPLLLVLVCSLIHHSFILIARWTGNGQLWCVQAVLVSFSWIAVVSATTFSVVNNVINLMEDRPLHNHPGRSYRPGDLSKPR